jgi:hypothetical protein
LTRDRASAVALASGAVGLPMSTMIIRLGFAGGEFGGRNHPFVFAWFESSRTQPTGSTNDAPSATTGFTSSGFFPFAWP